MPYPWMPGDVLTAAALNAEFAAALAAAGNFASPPVIGNTTPNAATFTTLVLTSLPTSASGLPTGALWNNGGVLCVA